MAVLVVKLAAALALLVHVLAGPAPGVGGAQVREAAGGDTYVTAYLNVTYRDVRGELHSERSETAKFGDGRIAGARGLLVHVASPNAPGGCSPPLLRAPTRARNSSALPAEPWIALVPRGHCTFDMKVHTAALAGAAAVIVYDDKEGDSLDMMDISPEHNITAVLTYHWKGVALVKLADSLHRVFVDIAVANRCTRSLNSINRTSVLFVSVSFIVLMIISLAWLVFYYVQRFRYIHAKDRLSRRLCTAAKRALSKIPTRRLKIDDAAVSGDGDCCAVCIERFRAAELVRTLPCRHEFHKGCIDPWLLEHRTCPMCKMDILKHYGFVFTGSQESILHLDIEEVAAFGLESPHLQPPRALLQQVREAPLHPPVIIAHLGQAGHAPQADDELPSITCGVPQTGPDPAPPPRADDVAPEGCARMQPQDGKVRAKVALDTLDTLDTLARVHGRPASPGAVSVASMASCGSTSSGSSSSSDSSSSVTDSILPPSKRPQPQIVGGDATQP